MIVKHNYPFGLCRWPELFQAMVSDPLSEYNNLKEKGIYQLTLEEIDTYRTVVVDCYFTASVLGSVKTYPAYFECVVLRKNSASENTPGTEAGNPISYLLALITPHGKFLVFPANDLSKTLAQEGPYKGQQVLVTQEALENL